MRGKAFVSCLPSIPLALTSSLKSWHWESSAEYWDRIEGKAESLINPWRELQFWVIQLESMKASLGVSEVEFLQRRKPCFEACGFIQCKLNVNNLWRPETEVALERAKTRAAAGQASRGRKMRSSRTALATYQVLVQTEFHRKNKTKLKAPASSEYSAEVGGGYWRRLSWPTACH